MSRRWRTLADDNSLWKSLCEQRGWEWRWPSIPHSPSPLLGGEDFDDEGMGDDEEIDSDGHGNSVAVQTIVYEQSQSHAVFGLPSTPRIHQHQHHRVASTKRRRPSPKPVSRAGSSGSNNSSKFRPFNYRHSAPSIFPSVDPPKPDYKHLHQTRILLANRMLHGSFRFSTLQNQGTPNAHTSIIYCLQLYTYPEDGRRVLFTGSKDSSVREWNLATGSVERVFEDVHMGSVLSLCVNGDYLATGGSDSQVRVWNIRDGSLVASVSEHTDSVLCVRFDSKSLVSCSKDRTVRLYRFKYLPSGQLFLGPGIILGTHRAAVNAVALSGSTIVSASGDKSIRMWDAETGHLLRTLEAHHARGIAALDCAPPLVLSGSSDKHIRMFDINTGRGWSTAPEFHDPATRGLGSDNPVCKACGGAFEPGRVGSIGLGVMDNQANRRASVAASETHTDLVRSVALGSEFVLSGSYDQSIKVWDRETGYLVADLSGRHEGRVFCVDFDCTKVRRVLELSLPSYLTSAILSFRSCHVEKIRYVFILSFHS